MGQLLQSLGLLRYEAVLQANEVNMSSLMVSGMCKEKARVWGHTHVAHIVIMLGSHCACARVY